MRNLISIAIFLFVTSQTAFAFEGQKTFMPENNLNLQELDGGLTEVQFNGVIDKAIEIYAPLFSQFGATLSVSRLWSDNTVNASADQPSATKWHVTMYGGLARRPEVSEDGFAMVLCHEFGHHLAGFPYVQSWAANEGQADVFATGACAFKLFTANAELDNLAEADLPDAMKAKCDAAHPAGDRVMCYRAMVAGKSLGDLLAGGPGKIAFDTPDPKVVSRTNNNHPDAQCRLDTYVAGAICGASKWDYALIPGKELSSRTGTDAQAEAFAHSCEEGPGARPACWFAKLNDNPGGGEECPYGDPALCDLMCTFDPTQPWCN